MNIRKSILLSTPVWSLCKYDVLIRESQNDYLKKHFLPLQEKRIF